MTFGVSQCFSLRTKRRMLAMQRRSPKSCLKELSKPAVTKAILSLIFSVEAGRQERWQNGSGGDG